MLVSVGKITRGLFKIWTDRVTNASRSSCVKDAVGQLYTRVGRVMNVKGASLVTSSLPYLFYSHYAAKGRLLMIHF